jgi:hypothetical protein
MAKRKIADTLPAQIAAAYGVGALIAILKAWAATQTDEQREQFWQDYKATLPKWLQDELDAEEAARHSPR